MTDPQNHDQLPLKGLPYGSLLEEMEAFRAHDIKWKEGKSWSLVYFLDEAHHELVKSAYGKYFSENFISPLAFPSVRKMEADLIRMTAGLLNGDENTTGLITSGGTESLFLAMYASRERAKRKHPLNQKPEVILATTAHPALHKAAHILGIKVKPVPVGDDFRVNIKELEKRISKRTILLVGSAPQYPHGILDPIGEIGELAIKYRLPFHVDSCIGGFMLPWVEKLGYPVPEWDFRVAGVSSISADLHKFAFGAKGASTLLYRDLDHLRDQFFITTDWPGGIYATSTMLGSRPAGPVAAAWAAMLSIGQEGYLEIAKDLMDGAKKLRQGICGIEGISVLGNPVMNITVFESDDHRISIYAIADLLEEKGWVVDRQQEPASIHTTMMPQNLPVIEDYLRDLGEAVEQVRQNPGLASEGSAGMYGMIEKIPFRGLVRNQVMKILDKVYGGDGALVQTEEDAMQSNGLSGAEKWVAFLLNIPGKIRAFFSAR